MAHLATGERDGKGQGGLGLDAVVAECAQVIQNTAITAAGISKCARMGTGELAENVAICNVATRIRLRRELCRMKTTRREVKPAA
jgi:hypothetical protein